MMTRAEASKVIDVIERRYITLDPEERQALLVAIKALEQEPILDKIRADIEQIRGNEYEVSDIHGNIYRIETIEKAEALQIIDKYITESEKQ